MLTKNALKRTVKLSQVKQSDYFKDFNFDALLSLNLEPCYKIDMPQETLKESITYQEYIQDSLKEFVPGKDAKPDLEYKKKVDEWFNKF